MCLFLNINVKTHLKKIKILGRDRVDVTIGSALDLFGGKMKFEEVLRIAEL